MEAANGWHKAERPVLSYSLRGHMKNSEEMFDILLPNLNVAIQRAQRAYERWDVEVPFHARNPATAVYLLVESLMAYV